MDLCVNSDMQEMFRDFRQDTSRQLDICRESCVGIGNIVCVAGYMGKDI